MSTTCCVKDHDSHSVPESEAKLARQCREETKQVAARLEAIFFDINRGEPGTEFLLTPLEDGQHVVFVRSAIKKDQRPLYEARCARLKDGHDIWLHFASTGEKCCTVAVMYKPDEAVIHADLFRMQSFARRLEQKCIWDGSDRSDCQL